MIKISRSSSQWLLATLCLIWAFFYVFLLSQTALFVSARLKTLDSLYQLRRSASAPLSHSRDIVIVGVDDESYSKMQLPWPWSRDIFTDFIEKIQKLEPKVVSLNFSFVGESSDPESDKRFAAALSKNKNVILTAYFDEDDQYVLPLKEFRQSALNYGFIDKPLDRDMVNRHVNPAIKLDNGNTYSMALQTAFASLGLSTKDSVEINEDALSLNNIEVPLDHQEQMWLSYRYKPSDFSYIPFWKIYNGQANIDELKGKTVIVGPISSVFNDISATPLGDMAGVFVNANETLVYMDSDYLRELLPGWQWVLAVLLAAGFALILLRLNYWLGLAALIILEALTYGLSFGLFKSLHWILEPFPLMFILGCDYVIAIFFRSLATFLENEALRKQAVTDGLTGLYGQRYLSLRLEKELNRIAMTKEELCFVMIDIDHFKKVNDVYGHEQGNGVLVTLAKFLKSGVRGTDIAARYGGEEFSLILIGVEEKKAGEIVDKIRRSVERHKFSTDKGELTVTISAGICSKRNRSVRSMEDLIRFADQALYQAKSQGRNQTCIYKAKTTV